MTKKVIVDIDGTISKIGDRLKYLNQDPPDWDQFYAHCDEDEPIQPIIDLLEDIDFFHDIYFFTGRRESCRAKTEQWIYDYLHWENDNYKMYMRRDGDHRHDTEVKPEFLDQAKLNIANVAFILEDRNSMVKKWRELGFTCLQVCDGNF